MFRTCSGKRSSKRVVFDLTPPMLVCFAALGLPVLGGLGCEYISGIDARHLDPAFKRGCAFSDDGDSAIRFVHAAPTFERADLCVKSTTEAQWPDRPLTRGVGLDCPKGSGYKQATAPRAVPSGSHDLKVVSSTARDCAAPAVAELSAVLLGAEVTTVIYAQRDSVDVLVALAEDSQGRGNVRFVHGVDGIDEVDAYMADTTVWPPARTTPLVWDLRFGALATGGTHLGNLTASGYLEFYLGRATFTFGLVKSRLPGPEPESDAPWLTTVSGDWDSGGRKGAFAVGRVGDSDFPPEFLTCSEEADDGTWTACRTHVPQNLATTVLDTTLSGINFPYYRTRAEQMGPVVAAADTDLMCLAFVMTDDDKRAIEAEAEKAGFAVEWAPMTLDTEMLDPSRLEGVESPVPFSEPPCSGQKSLNLISEIEKCLVPDCVPDRKTGIDSAKCPVERCVPQLIIRMTEHASTQRCGMCLAFSMADGSSFDTIEDLCTKNVKAGMSFHGNSGIMLLSRYPIHHVKHWALPSWQLRSSIAKASVDVPDGQTIDLYCTQLTGSWAEAAFPYLGPYGTGPFGENRGWSNETMLQAKLLLSIVAEHSGPRPAIVAGALESGPECPACDPPLGWQGPEILQELLKELSLGTTSDYTWQCLECADNPLFEVGGRSGLNLWTDHILTRGFARTDVLETMRVFDDATIIAPLGAKPPLVPPSTHYGLRSTIGVR